MICFYDFPVIQCIDLIGELQKQTKQNDVLASEPESSTLTSVGFSMVKMIRKSSQQILGNFRPYLSNFHSKIVEIICLKAPGNYSASI